MKYFVIFLIIIGLGYGAERFIENRNKPVPVSEVPAEDPDSVIEYISNNISELSPEKEVLGGTFYVTNITLDAGTGTVEYEDGHIALVADFTYEYLPDGRVSITSFELIDQE